MDRAKHGWVTGKGGTLVVVHDVRVPGSFPVAEVPVVKYVCLQTLWTEWRCILVHCHLKITKIPHINHCYTDYSKLLFAWSNGLVLRNFLYNCTRNKKDLSVWERRNEVLCCRVCEGNYCIFNDTVWTADHQMQMEDYDEWESKNLGGSHGLF